MSGSNLIKVILHLLLRTVVVASIPIGAFAQSVEKLHPAAPAIAITIELGNLDQSARTLNKAVIRLSETLNAISEKPENLQPDQILAVAELAKQTNTLVEELNLSINNVGPAIKALQQPTSEVVASWATSVSQNAMQPTIRSIDSTVSTWIRIVIIGLLVLLIIAGLLLYFSMRHLRTATENLQKIAGDYVIVRRDSLDNADQSA